MTPTPLRPCPTPDKHAYPTPGEAMAGFTVTKYARPYRCCCGHYHFTTKPKQPERNQK